jgi:hypothetical protein
MHQIVFTFFAIRNFKKTIARFDGIFSRLPILFLKRRSCIPIIASLFAKSGIDNFEKIFNERQGKRFRNETQRDFVLLLELRFGEFERRTGLVVRLSALSD